MELVVAVQACTVVTLPTLEEEAKSFKFKASLGMQQKSVSKEKRKGITELSVECLSSVYILQKNKKRMSPGKWCHLGDGYTLLEAPTRPLLYQ